jgi:DNA (cytosine-5)-methyltransferase 1
VFGDSEQLKGTNITTMDYNSNKPLRCFFAFEGYNSQGLALKRLQERYPEFAWECVGRSEIEPNAIQAADLLFPESADKNFGDIAKIDWAQVPDFDLFTFSFPCQSLSNAGLQHGMAENSGTRSSLVWECLKAIETKRPKYLLMENVKALLQRKFAEDFQRLRTRIEDLGYTNFYQVMNAKDYGVPQNRERVFMVSILKVGGVTPTYHFPKPFVLERRLRDVLEDDVPEEYYLKRYQVEAIVNHCERKQAEGCGFKTNFQNRGGISGAIKTKEGSREYDTYIKE